MAAQYSTELTSLVAVIRRYSTSSPTTPTLTTL